MGADLRDRLTDLAGHMQPGAPSGDLWTRGVRRRHAERVGTAVLVAVLVLLVGVGSWTWHAATRVQPAAPHGAAYLPDHFFFDISPWTHAFDAPPGPLVKVFPAVRETLFHTENGVVGVTGASGTYGFLDLPSDAVETDAVSDSLALSPDGRRLAFWISGRPSGPANTTLVDGVTITGVAVYDTVTGEVREHRIETVHGLAPSLLLWVDDHAVALGYAQILAGNGSQNSSTSHVDGDSIWDLGAPGPVALPGGTMPLFADNGSTRATRGRVIMPGDRSRSWVTFDPRHPASARTFRTDLAPDVLVLSPDHRRAIGVVVPPHADSGPLDVVRVPAGRDRGAEAHLRRLPLGDTWIRPLAWVDHDHVAVVRRIVVHDPVSGPHVAGRVELMDIRTGASRTLVAEYGANGTNESDPWVASDFFRAPSMHAVRPPGPPNLRLTVGYLGGAGLIGGLLLVAWGVGRARRP
jgi:hypothetical protein